MFLFYSPKKSSQRPQPPSHSQLNEILEQHCSDFEKNTEVLKQYIDASTNTDPTPVPPRQDYRKLFKNLEHNTGEEVLQIFRETLPYALFLASVAVISAK
jgi:hypothetical protein